MSTRPYVLLVKDWTGKGKYLRSRYYLTKDEVLEKLKQYPGVIAVENLNDNTITPRKKFK